MAENSNQFSKTFAGVIAIVALITGIAAIVRPLQQQIAGLERTIEQLEERYYISQALISMEAKGVALETAKIGERFKEVETQFKEVFAQAEKLEAWQIWWWKNGPKIHASQEERIKGLERDIYKGDK